MLSDIFVSTDVETNGNVAGFHSMLALGSVAFQVDTDTGYQEIAAFEANLLELPDGLEDADTMEWWKRHPEAWEYIRKNPEDPEVVMQRYLAWLQALPGKFEMMAYPASFDFQFPHWYLFRFTGETPLGHAALCSRSYVYCLTGEASWIDFGKKKIPEKYKVDLPLDHTPLQDARKQAMEFAKMWQENVAPSLR